MPGPAQGLLSFEARYLEPCIHVGIAGGSCHDGSRRAWRWPGSGLSWRSTRRSSHSEFDQENLDVGLHQAPVVICANRAGITGDDGASHNGVLDLVLVLVGTGPRDLLPRPLGYPLMFRDGARPRQAVGHPPAKDAGARCARPGRDGDVFADVAEGRRRERTSGSANSPRQRSRRRRCSPPTGSTNGPRPGVARPL